MALAPIRGAPPGALNPDFPVEAPSPKPGRLTAGPDPVDQPTIPKVRQRYSPIEIATGGVSLTFRVVPEQPAIARASMTVEVVAVGSSSQRMIGFLRMSASKARTFLDDLSTERSLVVASGDEDGDVQIELAVTEAGPALVVRKRGERDTLGRWVIRPEFNLKAVAADLLSDLGLPYTPK